MIMMRKCYFQIILLTCNINLLNQQIKPLVTHLSLNKTPGDDSVTTETPSSEELNADSDSVVPATDQPKIEMSEDNNKMVEYKAPLHKDKELLSKCWMTNLSPTWTSSAHIPLPNSKELLLLHYLCRGYESGFWPEGVPSGLWVPQVYTQLSRSEVYDIKKRIVGELACARALKRTPKTHKFYVEKETAHRAAQESREKHIVNLSMDQLYNVIVSMTHDMESQANNGGSLGQESAQTPWLLINYARLLMRTWFVPTPAISTSLLKVRGGKSTLWWAIKEGVVMPLQTKAGVVMPLHLKVGVVMPLHLT